MKNNQIKTGKIIFIAALAMIVFLCGVSMGVNAQDNSVATSSAPATEDYNISYYPNPTQEVLNVKIDSDLYGPVLINIYNEEGLKVKEVSFEANYSEEVISINLSDLKRAVYHLVFSNGAFKQVRVITRN
jgi:hypothetical protein